MNHFYRDVPGLGNVALSRHAQTRLITEGVSEETVTDILYHPPGPDMPDGQGIVYREGHGIRLVILLNPTPNVGAKLVKTAFRVKPQERVRY